MHLTEACSALLKAKEISSISELQILFEASDSLIREFNSSGRSRSYYEPAKTLECAYSRISPMLIEEIRSNYSLDIALLYCACSIAFVRWKLLDDFDDTAVQISTNIFKHYNSLIDKSPFFGSARRQLLPISCSDNIVYLCNHLPSAQTSTVNANIETLRSLIQDYEVARDKAAASMNLYVVATGATKDSYNSCPSFNIGSVRPSSAYLQSLTSASSLTAISLLRPRCIIFDYFSVNQLQLLYQLPFRTRVVYHSMGFIPLDLDIIDSYILFGYDNGDKSSSRMAWASSILNKCDIIKPVLHLKRFASAQRHLIHQAGKDRADKIADGSKQISLKICTFCRSSKISSAFLSVASELLDIIPESEFHIYGSGTLEDRDRLSVHERIKLSGPVDVRSVTNCDFYLETFPETQGAAIWDAIGLRIPVFSIKPRGLGFSFTGPRLQSAIVEDSILLARKIAKLRDNPEAYLAFCNMQLMLEAEVFGEPGDQWPMIEDFLLKQ